MATFLKKERLCSHILIRELLANGHHFYIYPFKCVWILKKELDMGVQIAFSVPKKKVKFAHQRNAIRRKAKNSYRINKASLLTLLASANCSINCLLVYSETKVFHYPQIDEKIKLVIQHIQKQLFVTLELNTDKDRLILDSTKQKNNE